MLEKNPFIKKWMVKNKRDRSTALFYVLFFHVSVKSQNSISMNATNRCNNVRDMIWWHMHIHTAVNHIYREEN